MSMLTFIIYNTPCYDTMNKIGKGLIGKDINEAIASANYFPVSVFSIPRSYFEEKRVDMVNYMRFFSSYIGVPINKCFTERRFKNFIELREIVKKNIYHTPNLNDKKNRLDMLINIGCIIQIMNDEKLNGKYLLIHDNDDINFVSLL